MRDYLVRAVTPEGLGAVAAITTNLVEEARRKHRTYPTATAALGRTLTAGVLMGSLLQTPQKLTIQILCNGPLEEIVVEADAGGNVRGFVRRPHIHLPIRGGKLDVARAMGKEGVLCVVKDLGLKEPYTGCVPLVSGEIARDITHYFAVSEQQPSATALGVMVNEDNSVKVAGGFLIQPVAGVSEEVIGEIEENLENLPSCSQLLLEEKTPEGMLQKVLRGFTLNINQIKNIQFKCRCSKERCREALIALGIKEVEDMLFKKREVEMWCNFCNEEYVFSLLELRDILTEVKRRKGPHKIH
ncbi:MAG: Hsp33 family molecular chaperone HslO [Actinomycetota bacterium]